jgi:hypothetical protein
MRRFLVGLVTLGCASGGGSTAVSAPAGPDRVILVDQGRVYRTTNDNMSAVEQLVPGTQEQVLQHLVGAYEEIGVSVNSMEPKVGRIASQSFLTPSRLGGQPITKYVDCGADQFGRPRAGTYAVTITTTSTVAPATTGYMRVQTLMTANARQRGVSGDAINCVSTSELEKRVNTLVAARSAR